MFVVMVALELLSHTANLFINLFRMAMFTGLQNYHVNKWQNRKRLCVAYFETVISILPFYGLSFNYWYFVL